MSPKFPPPARKPVLNLTCVALVLLKDFVWVLCFLNVCLLLIIFLLSCIIRAILRAFIKLFTVSFFDVAGKVTSV